MWTPNSALAAYIASEAKTVNAVDLYTLTLRRGITLRWTNADTDVRWDSQVWVAGPVISRSSLKYAMGLQTDSVTLQIAPSDADLIGVGSITVRQSIVAGDFDGAAFRLDRLYRDAQTLANLDAKPKMAGRLGTATASRNGFEIVARSMLYKLDAKIPGNIYQAPCRNVLFGAGCRLNPSTYSVAGALSSIASQRTFTGSGLPAAPDGHYSLGRFRFTSGLNQGVERQVFAYYASGVFTFARPWPYALVLGDAFEVLPGCDRKKSTCESKFGNLANFSGEPFIPAPETSL